MSYLLQNLEKTFRKLDTIISMVSTTHECDRVNIFLEEVIADLDTAIAEIKKNSNQKNEVVLLSSQKAIAS